MARISDRRGEWFELWCECREGTIECMVANMTADLNCGYDYFGNSIKMQRERIEAYKKEYEDTLEMFKDFDEAHLDRWCFLDMKKRGDID